jgi:hypothetical protein
VPAVKPSSRTARHRPDGVEDLPPVLVGDDPGPVGVRERQVVVVVEVPGGCRDVGIGTRRVGQVEQLGAGLVPERGQARPQPLDDLGEPGQAGPGLLQVDEVPDRVEDRQLAAAQQQLPVERGPVERPVAEQGGHHAARLRAIADEFVPRLTALVTGELIK